MENHHGLLPPPEKLSSIKEGKSDKSSVLTLLGSPTLKSGFDENTWYYINQKTEQKGIFKPNIAEQNVLEVHFDKNGTVESVKQNNKLANAEIDPSDKITDNTGRRLSFWEQFFGSVVPATGGMQNSKKP